MKPVNCQRIHRLSSLSVSCKGTKAGRTPDNFEAQIKEVVRVPNPIPRSQDWKIPYPGETNKNTS